MNGKSYMLPAHIITHSFLIHILLPQGKSKKIGEKFKSEFDVAKYYSDYFF